MKRYFVITTPNEFDMIMKGNMIPMFDITPFFEGDQIDQGLVLWQRFYRDGCRELLCDGLITERYLQRATLFLEKISVYSDLKLTIQDSAFLQLVQEKNLSIKIIFDPKTGGNNRGVYRFLSKIDYVDRIILSRELDDDKMIEYGALFPSKLRVQLLGPLLLMQTARPLVAGVVQQGISVEDIIELSEPKRPGERFRLVGGVVSDRLYHSEWIDLRKNIPHFQQLDIEMVIDLRGTTQEQFKLGLRMVDQLDDMPQEIRSLSKRESQAVSADSDHPDGMVIDVIKGGSALLKSDLPLKNGMILTFTRHKDRDVVVTLYALESITPGIYRIPWQRGIISGNKFYCS